MSVAATADDALELLRSQTFHVCLYDLGIQDRRGDELGILRKCCEHHIASIVQTGMNKGKASFEAAQIGAVEFLHKPYRFEEAAPLVNKWFLRRILCCQANAGVKDRWVSICEVLLTQHPASTYEWARAAGITRNRLKQICHECLNTEARHVFWLARSYHCAFKGLGLLWDPAFSVTPETLQAEMAQLSAHWAQHEQALSALVGSTPARAAVPG
jgi:ActR/RegA family two-component response regulator